MFDHVLEKLPRDAHTRIHSFYGRNSTDLERAAVLQQERTGLAGAVPDAHVLVPILQVEARPGQPDLAALLDRDQPRGGQVAAVAVGHGRRRERTVRRVQQLAKVPGLWCAMLESCRCLVTSNQSGSTTVPFDVVKTRSAGTVEPVHWPPN